MFCTKIQPQVKLCRDLLIGYFKLTPLADGTTPGVTSLVHMTTSASENMETNHTGKYLVTVQIYVQNKEVRNRFSTKNIF